MWLDDDFFYDHQQTLKLLNEIVDVNTDGVQNGFVLSYSSATNKYETQSFANVSATISQISGGTF